jgi:hypothetical protein
MKKLIINIIILFILILLNSLLLATDQWRVYGPTYPVHYYKNMYDPPPFCKWHKLTIGYSINSAPPNLNYLIDASFSTWASCGYLSFTSGNDILLSTISGENDYFSYSPFTYNSNGEITGSNIYKCRNILR